ncbi:MAG TPA: DJ-1/PfpI family protein [Oscillospiraceae bacterium]|nr:DJ-1/PfpI family protein [Oscillospiraceae bacterium]
MNMVYIFMADGFEELELIAPADMLRRAGAQVALVGIGKMQITSSHGFKINADLAEDLVDMAKAEMLVLPGGSVGTKNLIANNTVKIAVETAIQNNIWIGAICAAPSLLQQRGYLDGKNFTCYPDCQNDSLGGHYTGNPVEISGKIITAKGAGAALMFGKALTAALCGVAAAEKLCAAMMVQ